MQSLDFRAPDSEPIGVSPFLQMGAYEALWDEKGATFKTLAKRFAKSPGALPSDFVPAKRAREYANSVVNRFKAAGVARFGVQVHGTGDYLQKLRDAEHPVEVLYYRGFWDLAYSRSVAVVGSRTPSPEGLARTRKLVRNLVADDFTIVSGLAAGIDASAYDSA